MKLTHLTVQKPAMLSVDAGLKTRYLAARRSLAMVSSQNLRCDAQVA